MAFNAKMLGNALANRSRGLESDESKKINPENMPIKDDLGVPPVEPTGTFEIPVESLPDVVEGDVLTVTAVGDTVTLTKEVATPITPTVPPIA